jgi:hypothetical protein
MALPKKLLKSISLIPKKILQPRREELLEQIQKDGTYLPKGIYHADLDRGMLDFVKNDLGISVNGKVVNTVDVIITTQNWSQFTQTWNFQDLDSNIKPPFVATVRKPETPYGTNQGATNYRIPGRPLFQYALVPNFDGTRNGMDVYKIPQPIPVDITYEIKIFTNRMRELNAFNQKVLDKFSSRQAYVLIKGRYIPIIMESISDESVVELQKRRYFIQNYTFKMLGVLLDEEQFEVAPAVSRVLTMVDVSTKTRARKANALKPNPDIIPTNYQFIGSNTILSQTSLPTNYDFYFVNSNNVEHYSAFTLSQGTELFIGQDLSYFPMDTDVGLKIVIEKQSGKSNDDSSILFDIKLV